MVKLHNIKKKGLANARHIVNCQIGSTDDNGGDCSAPHLLNNSVCDRC